MSKETLALGLVLAASGLSDVLASLTFVSTVSLMKLMSGLVFVFVGVFTAVVGQVWHLKSERRPLGLTILSVSYIIGGILSLIVAVLSLDVFLFVSLVILSSLIFALVYLILKGSFYGLIGVVLLTFTGLIGSLLGIGNAGIVNVPGVLIAALILWYLYRPHVTTYFRQDGWQINLKMKHVILLLIFAIVVLVPVSFYYIYPPSRTTSMQMATSGSPSGGGSGSDMTFAVGDVIQFRYNVTSNGPVTVSIGLTSDSALVKTGPGMFGSGSATVSVSGQYWVFYETTGAPEASLNVKITVEMYSLRVALIQWALLIAYAMLALSLQGLAAERREPQSLAETQTGQQSPSTLGVDLFVAILIIAAATIALSVFQWFLWSSFLLDFVQIENYIFYFSLPVGIELAVAYVLGKGYLAHGQGYIIVFGVAGLVLGLLGAATIWSNIAASSLGPSVTLISVSGLLFAALNFFGAFLFRSKVHASSNSSGWRSRLVLTYAGSGVACVLVGYSAPKGLGSIFFGAPGVGLYNLPYEAFSLLTIVLLLASSILLFVKGSNYTGASFVGWYAAGLVLAAFLHLASWLNLPLSNVFDFTLGLVTVVADACALIFAFAYLRKTSLKLISDGL